MDIDQARALAQELMAFHGLTGWSFAFDRAKRRAGAAHFDRKQITLSRALTEASDDDAVRDTILHEIAHVLVGGSRSRSALAGNMCADWRFWAGAVAQCAAYSGSLGWRVSGGASR